MIQVLLADDEIHVCQLICALVDWDSLDMQVVGMAHNGIEALELIEKLHPAIVISDIRMPGYDGLEIIERAQKIDASIKFIIISGHAQFEYAQTAVRFGVIDYLLKPIKKEELTAALMKMRENYTRHTQLQEDTARLHMILQSDAEKLRSGLFSDWLISDVTHTLPDSEALNLEYHYHFKDGNYRAFVVKLDYDYDAYSETAVRIVKEKLCNLLKTEFNDLFYESELCFQDFVGYGICNYAPQHAAEIDRQLKSSIHQLLSQNGLFPNIAVSFGIGNLVNHTGALQKSLFFAKDAVQERLLEGTGRLYNTVPAASAIQPAELLTDYMREMALALEMFDETRALAANEVLKKKALEIPSVRGRELFAVVLAAGTRFTMSVKIDAQQQLIADFKRACDLCSTAELLFETLRFLVQTLFDVIVRAQHLQDTRPMRAAKQYIHAHYKEPLSLEDVSRQVGFNASYFSTLFKKECGMGFVEYLTDVRINQAKELLRDTHISVAEICELVGYNDLKHFTKTFYKYTGVKPGEFRKLYG